MDRSGRVLVAAYDQVRGTLRLATCWGVRCEKDTVAEAEYGFGNLAMTLDRAGRPVIAWFAGSAPGDVKLNLVIALQHGEPASTPNTG